MDVNGARMTSCAGNYDDGFGQNGGLITVGGVGDSNNNPVDPNSSNSGFDDELYNLEPFLNQNDNQMVVNTTNPSNDDIIFLAVVGITAQATVSAEICNDGIDNDGDGLVDGDDPDCTLPTTRIPRMPTLDQQLDLLGDPNVPPMLADQVIAEIVHLNLAAPLVLPTLGDPEVMDETMKFWNAVAEDLKDSIQALTDTKMDQARDDEVRAAANRASALLEAAWSVALGLKMQVENVDPTLTLPPHLDERQAEIESPFLPMPSGPGHMPVERTEVCNIGSGSHTSATDGSGQHSEACIITKETFGLKAVLYHKIIPIYQEPWDVRQSPIIGHKVVWYIKWVPAEHIKVIIHRFNPAGVRIKTIIRQHDVLMPGLNKFWAFFPPH